MCGIVGSACALSDSLSLTRERLVRMRDELAHRGPDDAGLWMAHNVALAHRRLAIIDPTPAGHQPMLTHDEQHAIIYNGELYNDAELRRDLERRGTRFFTHCDTETLLHTLAAFGTAAAPRLNGMYALAWFDRAAQRITLARDPLGIKPLYYWIGTVRGHRELVFASEPAAILAHPAVSARPDPLAINHYLTTIRTTCASRTLYDGIRTLRPGEWLTFDLRDPTLTPQILDNSFTAEVPEDDTRDIIEHAVISHLRTDVPLCSLLSGGLDSTIISAVAGQKLPDLHTFCAGAPDPADETGDLACARRAANALGLAHTQTLIDQAHFTVDWPAMIRRLAIPLSTPNEVAIHAVARTLKAQGCTVALSGEGADELFAGYDNPLARARDFHAANPGASLGEMARFEIETNAWIPTSLKPQALNDRFRNDTGHDEHLLCDLQREFDWCQLARDAADTPDDSPLRLHLLFQQRVNLAGLLQRLDTATMLASVEGRTPFADAVVAAHARSLPLDTLIAWHGECAQTKIPLRRAFAGMVPAEPLCRPKASFPLPFQRWMSSLAHHALASPLVREVFSQPAIELVATNPEAAWRIAWPMLNLALWDAAVFSSRANDNAPAEARAL